MRSKYISKFIKQLTNPIFVPIYSSFHSVARVLENILKRVKVDCRLSENRLFVFVRSVLDQIPQKLDDLFVVHAVGKPANGPVGTVHAPQREIQNFFLSFFLNIFSFFFVQSICFLIP